MPESELAQCDPLAAYRQANFSMFRIHPRPRGQSKEQLQSEPRPLGSVENCGKRSLTVAALIGVQAQKRGARRLPRISNRSRQILEDDLRRERDAARIAGEHLRRLVEQRRGWNRVEIGRASCR